MLVMLMGSTRYGCVQAHKFQCTNRNNTTRDVLQNLDTVQSPILIEKRIRLTVQLEA